MKFKVVVGLFAHSLSFYCPPPFRFREPNGKWAPKTSICIEFDYPYIYCTLPNIYLSLLMEVRATVREYCTQMYVGLATYMLYLLPLLCPVICEGTIYQEDCVTTICY